MELSAAAFETGKDRRFGTANPEKVAVPFREGTVRAGLTGGQAARMFEEDEDKRDFDRPPVWCAQRLQPLAVTPMIGENDVKTVVFGPDDAGKVLDFVRQTPWMRSLSFRSVSRDQAKAKGEADSSGLPQRKWNFTNRFKTLTP